MDTLPEPPDDVVPELNTRAPLMPFVPAFADLITMPPLDVSDPLPLASVIAPPV
jgi:hypothetical protein